MMMDKTLIGIMIIFFASLHTVHCGFRKDFGNYEFYFGGSIDAKFGSARENCFKRGMLPASITSQHEHNFVIAAMESDSEGYKKCWMGLKAGSTGPCSCEDAPQDECKASCRDSWVWFDGTPMTFQGWADGEPDDGETCAQMTTEGWDGRPCDEERNYICKRHVLCKNMNCTSDKDEFCQVSNGSPSCQCRPGFTGEDCKTNIDECDSDPCFHGATCQNEINHYKCRCAPGFTGANCETEIDECKSSPCENGGACSDGVDGYTCNCASGYTGEHCDTDINECESDPCVNGSCNDGIDGYNCTCHPGSTGTHCETDVDECASFPCINGATCVNKENAYQCECADGFTGENCETNIDECGSNPCLNGGNCMDKINYFECHCETGYTGVFCETDFDECVSLPCKNGGNCTDGVNHFTCACSLGYTGNQCETEVDECASNPCQDESVCQDEVNGYTCLCRDGLTGDNCDQDIEECKSDPCVNNGICVDLVNHYRCLCDVGFVGVHCENKRVYPVVHDEGPLANVEREDLVITLVVLGILVIIGAFIIMYLAFLEYRDRLVQKKTTDKERRDNIELKKK